MHEVRWSTINWWWGGIAEGIVILRKPNSRQLGQLEIFCVYRTRLSTYSPTTSLLPPFISLCLHQKIFSLKARLSDLTFQKAKDQALLTSPQSFLSFLRLAVTERSKDWTLLSSNLYSSFNQSRYHFFQRAHSPSLTYPDGCAPGRSRHFSPCTEIG